MIKKIVLFSCVIALASCSQTNTNENSTNVPDTTVLNKEPVTLPENELADFKFRSLVMNIPSPFEAIVLLQNAELGYKAELVNPATKEAQYKTSGQKALNYGSYVVDLIYISSNEQFSLVKDYFKTSRNLAQGIDCAEIFDKIAGSRLETYVDKKDTINKVIDEVYLEMDAYLRTNDRLLTATQILVGSWVESQYITTSLIKDLQENDKNKAVFERFFEQGYTIEKLFELIKEFENDVELKPILKDLQSLDMLYRNAKADEAKKKTLANDAFKILQSTRGKIVK